MKKLIGLLVIIMMLSFTVSVFAETATLSQIKGVVKIYAKGKWYKAKPSIKVMPGWVIVTGAQSYALLKLQNGTTITVKPLTKFNIDSLQTKDGSVNANCKLAYGKVNCKVKNQGSSKSNFNINTPLGQAGVRGTELDCSYQPDTGMKVVVYEGVVVCFTPAKDKSVEVNKGYSTNISNENPQSGGFSMENTTDSSAGSANTYGSDVDAFGETTEERPDPGNGSDASANSSITETVTIVEQTKESSTTIDKPKKL